MQPGPTFIFLDSNILLSRTLRDWFCQIDMVSGDEGIALKWSEDVLAEFIYHMRKNNPSLSDKQIGGWRRRLVEVCPDAMITEYSIRDEFLAVGSDKFDAHVAAAAEHGGVDYLVTNNLKDFRVLEDELEFEIYNADDMLCLIDQRRPDAVRVVLQRQLTYWKDRSGSKSLDEALSAAGAPCFAANVKNRLGQLAMSGRY